MLYMKLNERVYVSLNKIHYLNSKKELLKKLTPKIIPIFMLLRFILKIFILFNVLKYLSGDTIIILIMIQKYFTKLKSLPSNLTHTICLMLQTCLKINF